MGSVNDNIQSALSPIYGAKSTNHLIQLFREDHGLLENDRWQAYLQGTPLSDITGLSPVGSLNDIERLLFENFAELHNESTGLYLPGTTGNYVSTPDHADLDITGDLCLIIKLSLVDWTPSVAQSLLAKWPYFSNTKSFLLQINTNGRPRFFWSADGTATLGSLEASSSISILDGEIIYLALTFNVDTGASQASATYWTSENGETWIKLGNVVFYGSATSIFSGSSILELGSHVSGTTNNTSGTVYSAQIYDGIGDNSAPGLGTLVAEFDASAPVGPRYRDRTGKIWTINGSAWSWE